MLTVKLATTPIRAVHRDGLPEKPRIISVGHG
jgi:hypothetical protein